MSTKTIEVPIGAAVRCDQPKVLQVLEATLGGTLRFMEDIITCSADMPFSMGWAYATERASASLAPALQKAADLGWDTFPLQMTRSIDPVSDFKSVLSLRKLIHDYRPDILHCHSSKAGAVGRLAVMGLRKRPIVVYQPNALAVHLGKQYVLIERALSAQTDCFAAVSEGESDEIVRYKVGPKEKIRIISPGLDTTYFAPANRLEMRRKLNLPEHAPIVVGVGRLCEQKDPEGFVHVVDKLTKSVPDVRGIWVGDGELRRSVEALSAKLGLTGRIILPGWQTDVRPYVAAGNLLLSTSRYESFGYMVAEALAMQRPVVATRVNGTTDILQGELRSFLYSPGAYDDAANLVGTVLLNSDLAERLALASRASVLRAFSYSEMRKSLQNCYEALLGQADTVSAAQYVDSFQTDGF